MMMTLVRRSGAVDEEEAEVVAEAEAEVVDEEGAEVDPRRKRKHRAWDVGLSGIESQLPMALVVNQVDIYAMIRCLLFCFPAVRELLTTIMVSIKFNS
jgi:hypothetical protein